MRWAQAVYAVLSLLLVGVVPAVGVASDAVPDAPQKTAQSKEQPEKLQLLPVRRYDVPEKNVAHVQEPDEPQKTETSADSMREEAVPVKQETEKPSREEQGRKERELERRAAREAAAAAKEEAAQARREAEKLRKEEEDHKERERAAAKKEQERLKKKRAVPEETSQEKRAASGQQAHEQAVAATPEIKDLAYKAGLYAYPLVLADAVRRADAQTARQTRDVDLFRQFFHSATVPDVKRTPGVLPRADSLYSLAWLELKNSPYLLEIPAMPGRHYLIQILDAWTRNLPAISARDTGGKSGKYIVLLQGTAVPAAYAAEYAPLYCPTSLCMLLARIEVKTPEDARAACEAQQGLRLTPLFPEKLAERTASSDTAPVRQLAALDAEEFFSRFTRLLADNPASDQDVRMKEALRRLGIAPGQKIFFSLDEPLRKAAADGCRQALAGMGVYYNTMSAYPDPMDRGKNGWNISVMDVGTYGTRYDMRSHLAAADFGMARPRDMLQAVLRVDADGKFLDGENKYVLRFEPGQLPPAAGFWSLTLYTATLQLHDNKMQRYALTAGSNLVAEADGSTVIYLQPKAPSRKYQANWLPTPDLGYFFLVLRLYAPEQRALNADWHPPKVAPEKRKTVWDTPAPSF
jgi:hypothetical protein